MYSFSKAKSLYSFFSPSNVHVKVHALHDLSSAPKTRRTQPHSCTYTHTRWQWHWARERYGGRGRWSDRDRASDSTGSCNVTQIHTPFHHSCTHQQANNTFNPLKRVRSCAHLRLCEKLLKYLFDEISAWNSVGGCSLMNDDVDLRHKHFK